MFSQPAEDERWNADGCAKVGTTVVADRGGLFCAVAPPIDGAAHTRNLYERCSGDLDTVLGVSR